MHRSIGGALRTDTGCIPGLVIPVPCPGAASRPRSGVVHTGGDWINPDSWGDRDSVASAAHGRHHLNRMYLSTRVGVGGVDGCAGVGELAGVSLCWPSQYKGNSGDKRDSSCRTPSGAQRGTAARAWAWGVVVESGGKPRGSRPPRPSHSDDRGVGAYGAIGAVPRGARIPTCAPGSVFILMFLASTVLPLSWVLCWTSKN